jgi:hypothetical protein
MSEEADVVHPDGRCRYAWCTTEHGHTSHPDDEDHRSDGLATALVGRRTGQPSTAHTMEVEVGLYRRRDDDQTWLALDDGGRVRMDVSLASARALMRAVLADPVLAEELRSDS